MAIKPPRKSWWDSHSWLSPLFRISYFDPSRKKELWHRGMGAATTVGQAFLPVRFILSFEGALACRSHTFRIKSPASTRKEMQKPHP
jgi:hypothetical protein